MCSTSSRRPQFSRWLVNSYLIALGTVIITVLTAVPAGYALARLNLPGAGTLSIAIFLTYLVPPSLLFIPLSQVVARLHLTDSIWALIIIYPTFTIPFCTWLMMGFFKTIPFDIEEAALIDGCNRIEAIRRVVLPLSRAGIFSIMMFAFTLALAGIHLCPGVHLHEGEQAGDARRRDRPDSWRCLLLGRVDGGRHHRRVAGGDPL